MKFFLVTILISLSWSVFSQKTISTYTIPRYLPTTDGDVFKNIHLKVETEVDEMLGRINVNVYINPDWEAYKYGGKLYSIEEINKRNAIKDPHFDGFVFDKGLIIPKLDFNVVLNDGQSFNLAFHGGEDFYRSLELEHRPGKNTTVKSAILTNKPKNNHVHTILSHKLCSEVNNGQVKATNTKTVSNSLISQSTGGNFAKPSNTSPNHAENIMYDPAEVLKSEITNVFAQLAAETGDERIVKVAKNCQNIRTYAAAFKAATPDYLNEINKIENYSMLVGVIAPFIFNQSSKQKQEAIERQLELQNLRDHDERTKQFEKQILLDVLTIKEYVFKYYYEGEKEKFLEYYKAYNTLLNTPVAMYKPEALMFNFYSDLDRDKYWKTNVTSGELDAHTKSKLLNYKFNTTIGEIYYGTGKNISAKRALDNLIYLAQYPNIKDEDILDQLKGLLLFDAGAERISFQPFLFALNFAKNSGREDLFRKVWKMIDNSYAATANTLEKIQVSKNAGEQKKHLKSIGYFSSDMMGKHYSPKAVKGMFNTLNYAILKGRYDLLSSNPLDEKYDYRNVIVGFMGHDLKFIRDIILFNLSSYDQSMLLQLLMENVYRTQEHAIKHSDKDLFLSVMREAMNISNNYAKISNGSKAKEKNNYFRPTYYNEVLVDFISSFDYLKHAKGYATIDTYYTAYTSFETYTNKAFTQDSKMIYGRMGWYNAWAHFFRTGQRDKMDQFKSEYSGNPYVVIEWLVAFGNPGP